MNKKILSLALMMGAFVSMSAQSTARKFVLQNSADGNSQLTCYLPQNPTGRAVVDCPGAVTLISPWTMRDISGLSISISRASPSLS